MLVEAFRRSHAHTHAEGVVVGCDPVVADDLANDAAQEVALERHVGGVVLRLDELAVAAIGVGLCLARVVLHADDTAGRVVVVLGLAALGAEDLRDASPLCRGTYCLRRLSKPYSLSTVPVGLSSKRYTNPCSFVMPTSRSSVSYAKPTVVPACVRDVSRPMP